MLPKPLRVLVAIFCVIIVGQALWAFIQQFKPDDARAAPAAKAIRHYLNIGSTAGGNESIIVSRANDQVMDEISKLVHKVTPGGARIYSLGTWTQEARLDMCSNPDVIPDGRILCERDSQIDGDVWHTYTYIQDNQVNLFIVRN